MTNAWKTFLLGSLLLAALTATAHELGLSMEEKVGDYLIDVGYDRQLVANEQILFDFNLYNVRRDGIQDDAEFSDVGFEVTFHGNVIFSRRVPKNAAKTYMTVTFPTSGEYDLHPVYFRGDEKFVEHTFSMTVAEGVEKTSVVGASFNIVEIFSYSVALLAAAAAGILLLRNRRMGPPMPPSTE